MNLQIRCSARPALTAFGITLLLSIFKHPELILTIGRGTNSKRTIFSPTSVRLSGRAVTALSNGPEDLSKPTSE
jgi:hypothetical protein